MITDANIFLIGPMGAGKSSIGQRLAERLKRKFYDSDQVIMQRTGVDIPTIFEYEGEAGFRKREYEVIQELAHLEKIVLSTGGGAILDERTGQTLAQHGFVIYLKASVATQLTRIKQDNSRPLLTNVDPEKTLQQLAVTRNNLYESIARCTIETDRKSAHQMMEQIIAILKSQV